MKSRTPWGYDVLVFGLFDRLGIGSAKRREAKARKLELAGDLEGATALYVDAERPDEAARVLLLRADAEARPARNSIHLGTQHPSRLLLPVVREYPAATTGATDPKKKTAESDQK